MKKYFLTKLNFLHGAICRPVYMQKPIPLPEEPMPAPNPDEPTPVKYGVPYAEY